MERVDWAHRWQGVRPAVLVSQGLVEERHKERNRQFLARTLPKCSSLAAGRSKVWRCVGSGRTRLHCEQWRLRGSRRRVLNALRPYAVCWYPVWCGSAPIPVVSGTQSEAGSCNPCRVVGGSRIVCSLMRLGMMTLDVGRRRHRRSTQFARRYISPRRPCEPAEATLRPVEG